MEATMAQPKDIKYEERMKFKQAAMDASLKDNKKEYVDLYTKAELIAPKEGVKQTDKVKSEYANLNMRTSYLSMEIRRKQELERPEINKAIESYNKQNKLFMAPANKKELEDQLVTGDVKEFKATDNLKLQGIEFRDGKITVENQEHFFTREVRGFKSDISFMKEEADKMKAGEGIVSKHPMLQGGYFMDEKGKIHESCLENTAKFNFKNNIENLELKHDITFSKDEIRALKNDNMVFVERPNFKGVFVSNGNEINISAKIENGNVKFNDKIQFNSMPGSDVSTKAANFKSGLDGIYKETGLILNRDEKSNLLKNGTISISRKNEGVSAILSINKTGEVVPLSVMKGNNLLMGNTKVSVPMPSTLYNSKSFGLMDIANCKDKEFLGKVVSSKNMLTNASPVIKAVVAVAKVVLGAIKALTAEREA